MKKRKIVVAMLVFVCSLGLFAQERASKSFSEIHNINPDKHFVMYNKILQVEDAYSQVKLHPNLGNVLFEANEVITRYKVEQYFGLRLLHVHFELDKGEVIVEEQQVLDGVLSLVSCARSLEEAQQKKAVPSSWIVSAASPDIHVFETTTDSAAKEGAKLILDNPEFINEIRDVLIRNNMAHLLSLAVLKRDGLVPQQGQVYLEKSYNLTGSSIIQANNDVNFDNHHIPTSWSFGEPKQCSCVLSFWCYDADYGHVKGSTHN